MALTNDQITALNFADYHQMILPYLNGGGVGLKLLWENQNPTQSFAAQNVTLSSDDYDLLITIYNYSIAGRNISNISVKGSKIRLVAVDGSSGSGTVSASRDISYTSSTILAVNECYFSVGTTAGSVRNEYIIPYRIYGIKVYNRDVPAHTTLLWSNPNPSSAFAAQDVTLANSDYDQLHIIGIRSTSNPCTIDCYIEKGKDGNLSCVQATNDGVKCESRYFTRTSDTEYAVATGRVAAGATAATADTSVAIPLYVYGIKF